MAALLVGASLAAPDGAGHGHGPSQEGYGGGGGNQGYYSPQVKYAGPIVYSGEKPPIIHFPPPPEVRVNIGVYNPGHKTPLFSALLL